MEGKHRRGQEEPRRVTFAGNHASEFTLHIGFSKSQQGVGFRKTELYP